ncbi:MAG: hypothetical protein ACXABD_14935 [Candidatus Thorarchaeota archaeon]|jgi:hypothetical protein
MVILERAKPTKPGPGDLLSNGAEILAIRETSVGRRWIVLCKWQKAGRVEYITWVLYQNRGDTVPTPVFGRYFAESGLEAAVRDYARRS